MTVTARSSDRFSLLLLDDGEQYVTTCIATMESKLPGTLRICTKSLFFEPEDVTLPIVRVPFASATSLDCNQARNTMSIATSAYVLMKAGGLDVPYTFVKEKRDVSVTFNLVHMDVHHIHVYAQQMVALSRLPPKESVSFQEVFLEGIERASRFDCGLLREPLTERVLVEVGALLCLSQMAKVRGKFVVGTRGVYFEPLHDLHGRGQRWVHEHERVAGVLRRRSAGQDVAMEIVYRVVSKESRRSLQSRVSQDGTWFLVFRDTEERERVFEALCDVLSSSPSSSPSSPAAPILDTLHHEPQLSKATRAWQRGAMTNFEYLVYLNVAAGRSFNDLAQYPVFPWVLNDYTSATIDLDSPSHYRDLSKPVGALNPTRLETFRQRYRDMRDLELAGDAHGHHAFMYGTHYSCPAYVLFWLVRVMPGHQLRLQGGKFDAPDRLFHSVRESFVSVMNSTSDVKELVPEMYGTDASFLRNDRCLPLGCRQNGSPVGDVELPEWASGSADEFLRVMRAALESEYVSSNLHSWIDLTFGVHQQSIEKDNVFRAPTECAPAGGSSAEDVAERAKHMLEVEEFGTCPRQIFFEQHPPRKTKGGEGGEGGERTFAGLALDVRAVVRASLPNTFGKN